MDDNILAVAKFMISHNFRESLFGWMEKNSQKFADSCKPEEEKSRAQEIEHSVWYTELYNEFCETYEKQIEEHITKLGCSSQEIRAYLRDNEESKSTSSAHLLYAILVVFDYENFVEVMRDQDKRAYLEQIMRAHARNYLETKE